ncbi:MAG: 1,3-beta-galactosyl-N-acetylhexosamine phosphorylase, partial [Ruminococcus sp.]
MSKECTKGRVTIPTDVDVVPETLELVERWGADAIRDCDGTDYPEELKKVDAKVYATYYTTRKDNEWAKANPDEIQQMYIMTSVRTATKGELSIHLMDNLYPDMLKVNSHDDIKRWWEVIDRTTGEVVPVTEWSYSEETGDVTIRPAKPFHDYTVSFLAYIMWDPVHMYNAVTNDWQGVEKQITFDVRQPKTKEFSKKRLRKFLEDHPYVDVIRFTTFFHQFTLIFDELAREKYVDWYGYSASVSPYILEQFEQEVGYRFRPEFIIDQGYMNNMYRIPSKEFLDFTAFQRREVTKLAKEFVDIVHEYGKEAMMFLGDHWIGMEPFMEEFKSVGLDAVVGSVGNGATLRLISDIPGVKYTEGRFLPYFFPDTFYEGGDPVKEAKVNWVTARRAILRKPIDRIGYGGYLKLAVQFPDFIEYVEGVCKEFRTLYENIKGTTPYCVKKVAVLNSWGKMRAWGNHMVHHAIYHKQNYSYAGIMETLSGAPFDVQFLTFDEVKENPDILKDIDVILNVGDGDTAYTGGANWEDADLVAAINQFVYNGGGFIGIGEPTGHQWQGKYIQLRSVLGVERENGFDLNKDKYNWEEHDHFIIEDCKGEIDFGEGKKNMYAMPDTTIIKQKDKEVQMAVNEFGDGRGVYISGLPYSFENSRLLYRAILWASHDEENLHKWFSTNYNVEVHAYV